uniref:Uncharacterized protein n=1 Tax=Setaria italica TaxID=4555 RepID=K3ZGH7_SETIT
MQAPPRRPLLFLLSGRRKPERTYNGGPIGAGACMTITEKLDR